MESDIRRQFLRHTLATLAYRGQKALAGCPPDFGDFRVSDTSRTPLAILAHIGDLLDWAICLANGKHTWKDSMPVTWEAEVARFFTTLAALDEVLRSSEQLGFPPEKLFQGPVADALTHIGQICMLRRVAGVPVKGENYFKASIVAGRVSREQAAPVFEFD